MGSYPDTDIDADLSCWKKAKMQFCWFSEEIYDDSKQPNYTGIVVFFLYLAVKQILSIKK